MCQEIAFFKDFGGLFKFPLWAQFWGPSLILFSLVREKLIFVDSILVWSITPIVRTLQSVRKKFEVLVIQTPVLGSGLILVNLILIQDQSTHLN